MRWLADLVGVSTIAAIIGCLTLLVPRAIVPGPVFWWTGLGVAVVGLFLWHDKSAPVRPRDWLKLLGFIVLLDMGSFCIDMFVGELTHPHLSPLKSAMEVGSPFGFAATSILIPATFIAAVGGLIRSRFLHSIRRSPDIGSRQSGSW